ncbi:uncharacterized protein LOC21390681 isoform X2 [Morus notabilis]|uniref:uncharacterized protein LOC21390681 isoform X2 n=1 Tax=Morus notabilis TaxID=981085 RepID=UPI000CED25C3|nr:uncharacterized protein LOC21390681 isoform X2 [Morus notabilis]
MVDGKEAAKRSTDGVSDSQYWRYDVSQKRQKHGDGDGNKLCFIFVSSGSCPRGEKCHFQHDADAREQSMRGVCLIFSTRENVKRVQIATSSTAYKMKDEKFLIWYSGQEERQLRVSSIMMIISGGAASACPRRRIGTAGTRCPATHLCHCISGRGGTMEGTMGEVLEEGLDLAIEG